MSALTTAYHLASHYNVRKRHEQDRFSLIVRLPDASLLRIKRVKDGTSIQHVRYSYSFLVAAAVTSYQSLQPGQSIAIFLLTLLYIMVAILDMDAANAIHLIDCYVYGDC